MDATTSAALLRQPGDCTRRGEVANSTSLTMLGMEAGLCLRALPRR